MPDQDYVHGIRVVKGGNEVRVVLTPNQAVVGVVGTAQTADAKIEFEKPVAFQKKEEALKVIRPDAAKPDNGTLYPSVKTIFTQGARTVVVVRAKSDSAKDISAAIEKLLEAEALTNHKPKILCAPGHTAVIPAQTPAPNPTPAPTPNSDPDTDEPGPVSAVSGAVNKFSANTREKVKNHG